MKHNRKILAILLTIAMTICLLPAEVIATDELKTEEMSVGVVTSEEEVVESVEVGVRRKV